MKKVSIYLKSKDVCPSAYYRFLQYTYKMNLCFRYRSLLPPCVYEWYHGLWKNNAVWRLSVQGMLYFMVLLRTTFFLLDDAFFRRPELILVQRTLMPRYMPFFVYWLARRAMRRSHLIWDFDDDIFDSGEVCSREKRLLMTYAQEIIVINDHLKQQLPKSVHHKVVFLPTTDGDMQNEDLKQLNKEREEIAREKIKLVWVATPSNVVNLLYVLPQIDKVASRFKKEMGKQLELIVVCSLKISYSCTDLILENRRWTHQVAIDAMKEAHIGIMPLIYDQFALGKGGFKLIQYISVGLPVIASGVGYNHKIVTPDCGVLVDDIESPVSWETKLFELITRNDLSQLGQKAYQRWKDKFSYEYNYVQLENFFRKERKNK